LPAEEKPASKVEVPFIVMHDTNDYPTAAILDVAKNKKCDVIVMATQGEGGLRGVFIGSVTQKVLIRSKLPVLVIR
jgi:nucleotide-binding universal stress UspA family protein